MWGREVDGWIAGSGSDGAVIRKMGSMEIWGLMVQWTVDGMGGCLRS